ncbi:MAG: hypothetical protein HY721_18600 [Planctomycetes bacterium]|nr:hypothetical protein [Planctomycetota bacterium]
MKPTRDRPAAVRLLAAAALRLLPLALALPAAARGHPEPGGSILLPAYSFDRGNLRAMASESWADAEPIVVNGGTAPNWAEYDIDFPVSATYSLHARYAAAEARPVDVYLDRAKAARGFGSTTGSWMSSTAAWEKVCDVAIERGKRTLRLECPGPCIPHIVALRLDAAELFPEGWKLERPGARKLDDRLGSVAGPRQDRDGFEAFLLEDGTVAVPDDYNPIVRFRKLDPPHPAAHRVLELALLGEGRCRLEAAIVPSTRPDGDGWAARLTAALGGGRTESAELPLSTAKLREVLERTARLIAEHRAAGGGGLEEEAAELERVSCDLGALARGTLEGEARWRRAYDLYLQAFRLEDRVALANPLLRGLKLVFVKRATYDTSHIYTTHFDGSHRFGGGLYVLEEPRPDAAPRRIASELEGGIFRDPDVSWDGERVVFSYKPPDAAEPYRIYEVRADGTGLRRLTDTEHDDVDPVYLPDRRIGFISTRARRVVLCHNAFTVSVLHSMAPDGSDVRCLSANTVNEFTPSVAADGSLLYTRWEYVDKNVGNNQSLWRARPDGTFATHVAGAHWGPITFWEPRQVPGSRLVVCTLAPHMPIAAGPIALVDPLDACRSPAAFTSLTPELPPPHHFAWHRTDVGYYMNPWPLSEDWFIVSYAYGPDPREPRGYGLYLLDRTGHRYLLHRDPETSSFEAMPAVPRPRPPALAAATGGGGEGAFVVLDVYAGLHGVERGEVKSLRVVEEVPKPVSADCQGHGLQHPAVSRDGNFAVKVLLGEVPVEADGSASFRAPAAKALYFAALDADGLEIQRMRSFVHLEAGQTVTCAGCHEDRRTAPPNAAALALKRPPSRIEPPPGGAHAPDFRRDVQPVLDRHCGRCHSGDRTDGGIDLSGDATNLFNVAYDTLTSGWVSYVNIYSSATLALRPPRYYGSHASKLVKVLRGEHRRHVEVPPDALRSIATWIDLNAPYYGTYQFSRRGTGGRELVQGKPRAALEEVFARRCASCHKGEVERARRVRVPSIERSPALRMPLAAGAGGAGRCAPAPFASTSDPDYRRMLEALEALRADLERDPREDMLAERPPPVDPLAPFRPR